MSEKSRIGKRKDEYRKAEKKYKRDRELKDQFRRLDQTIPPRKKKTPLTDKELTALDNAYRATITLLSTKMNPMDEVLKKYNRNKAMLDILEPYMDDPYLILQVKDEATKAQITQELERAGTYKQELATLKVEVDKNIANYTYMEKLRKTLSKDLKAIVLCKKTGEHPSITQLFENSRSEQIQYDLSKAKKYGGSLNTRYYIDQEGKDGFFTISRQNRSVDEQLADVNKEINKKYGEHSIINTDENSTKELVNSLLNNEFFSREMLSKSDKYLMESYSENGRKQVKAYLSRTLSKEVQAQKLAVNQYRILNRFLSDIDTPETFMSLIELINKSAKVKNAAYINKIMGIKPDCKQDKRNSFASMIADTIGCKNIIANAENMRIKDPATGKIYHGTFMKKAEGLDLDSTDKKTMSVFNNLSPNKLEGNLSLKKDIANIQVIDWIIGNPDRHTLNMLYRFDDNGNLTGIVGIDNDTCLGTSDHTIRMSGIYLDNLTVIPKDTAEHIMSLDRESIKNMYYGFDASSEEIEASIKRIEKLQNKIKNDKEYFKDKPFGYVEDGCIRVMSDDELGQTSLFMDLSQGKKILKNRIEQGCENKNLFAVISTEALEANTIKSSIAMLKKAAYTDTANAVRNHYDMEKSVAAMERSQNSTHFVHQEFGQVLTAVNDCRDTFRSIEDCLLIHSDGTKEQAPVFEASAENINKYKEKLNIAINKCDAYLNTKDEASIKKKSKKSNAYIRYKLIKDTKKMLKRSIESLDGIVEKTNRVAEYRNQIDAKTIAAKNELETIKNHFGPRKTKMNDEVSRINEAKKNNKQPEGIQHQKQI